MTQSDIQIVTSGGGVGAFIEGLDLSDGVTDNVVGALREALGAHGVLFFRDQNLTPEQHCALAEQFGPININRFFAHVEGYPMIAEVRKEPEQTSNIGGSWHTDHSYDEEPALGSILLARETPTQGGDTVFANMYTAFETLSEGMKETLSGMRAVHSSARAFGKSARYVRDGQDLGERLGNQDAATQENVHPVIIRHPISGRRSLYVNSAFTLRFDGWSEEESLPLLNYLYAHAAKVEHTYRFQWAPGSLAFWDNRATWHYAVNDYAGARRLMHRITIEGEALAA